MLDVTVPLLPADRPRYLMGVGKPDDLVGAVARGIDLFDCVLPTRSGRTGQAFTRFGPINLRNARHADDPRPLDESIDCPASRDFSRAYLHHLVRCGEILGAMLLTWHNVAYYAQLMAEMRAAIAAGRFAAFAGRFRPTGRKETSSRGDVREDAAAGDDAADRGCGAAVAHRSAAGRERAAAATGARACCGQTCTMPGTTPCRQVWPSLRHRRTVPRASRADTATRR